MLVQAFKVRYVAFNSRDLATIATTEYLRNSTYLGFDWEFVAIDVHMDHSIFKMMIEIGLISEKAYT